MFFHIDLLFFVCIQQLVMFVCAWTAASAITAGLLAIAPPAAATAYTTLPLSRAVADCALPRPICAPTAAACAALRPETL